ncbi:MAG: dihydrodipicolinate reductase C-terminal domain-containing protein [Bacteriovoracaceae bacterium]
MKIALIGTGKTGGEVLTLIENDKSENNLELVGPFNSRNVPTKANLKLAEAIIVFTAAEPTEQLIPLLLELKVPVVLGSTGVKWPNDLNEKLIKQNQTWIYSSNFSLGMNVVRNMIKTMNLWSKILSNPKFSIHEIHHTKKLDAPSGTALSWKSWLPQNHNCEITHAREGDVKGYHKLTIETDNETITLDHNVKNRRIFAEGALFAAIQVGQVKKAIFK